MKYVALVCGIFGAVLLYLLSHFSASNVGTGQNYFILLVFNIAMAVFLTGLIGWQLWKLYRQKRAQVMGSRLTLRLLGMFAMMAIIPGLLVYAVSVNFLTRSIESWFNVKVEAALDGGLKLGQSALDILLNDLKEKGESMALSLAFQPINSHLSILNELRDKSGVQDAALLTPQGRIIAISSGEASGFLPELPLTSQLHQARLRVYGIIEPIPGKGLYLRVLAPVNTADLRGEMRILQLLQPVPKTLSDTAESVQDVYQDYQELSYTRNALKDVFALTLTLVMMLSMLSAIALAFVLSRRLSAPLGVLAEGTRAIASGDYGKVLPEHGKDELGILVRSFNSMTRQLAEATQSAERNRVRVEAARGYLETILAHLSSGVLALDEDFRLRTFNPAAAQILRADLNQWHDQPFTQMVEKLPEMGVLCDTVQRHFAITRQGEWQEQIEISGQQGMQVLLVRGTCMPQGAGTGYVVVFDDVTTLIQAQRNAAWREVARRLAHEIKNPLTPIQLSAERIEHKLASKLSDDDAELLRRATNTIVSQVSAMKNMVNEFSEYARSPMLKLDYLDLTRQVREVLMLYESSGIRIVTELESGLPPVYGDAAMLRQVVHNLLQNAQDALEGQKNPRICVISKLEKGVVKLSIIDNGCGVPQDILTRVFEPYVTTKQHGTGLGLAIVKKIMDEHMGSIKIENLNEGGACVSVTFPAAVVTS